MSEVEIMAISRDLLVTAVYLAGPAILASMVVGTLVSIFQTITSIQEQTLSFAPRMVTVFAVILIMLPYSLKVVVGFTMRMMEHAGQVTQ
jgi:flagellar biosynthetic protein FliQ